MGIAGQYSKHLAGLNRLVRICAIIATSNDLMLFDMYDAVQNISIPIVFEQYDITPFKLRNVRLGTQPNGDVISPLPQ